MKKLRYILNTCLGLAAVLVGIAVLVWLVRERPDPPHVAAVAAIPQVRLAKIEPLTFQEPVVGYGTVKPMRQVNVIPEVSGMLIQVHEDLAVGKTIRKGELLFQIDPRTYNSQVLQVRANVKQVEVQLRGLQQEEAGLTTRLETARQQFSLAEENYNREKDLLTEGATRKTEEELAREHFLLRRDAVQAYESQLALIPYRIDEANARLDGLRAQLEEAERNVDRTRIECPFDARVDMIGAQKAQAVTAYFSIATLTDLEAFEIPTVIDPRDLLWVDRLVQARVMGRDLGTPPQVSVTWTGMGRQYTWHGSATRLERHDEATRTDRLIVEVPNMDLESVESSPLLRPNLSLGMFVSAELPAEPLTGALVVPRHVIQDGNSVYVFEPDGNDPNATTGRLGTRRVPMIRIVGDRVLVYYSPQGEGLDGSDLLSDQLASCELRPGDEILLTTLNKPVLGMRIQRVSEATLTFAPSEPLSIMLALGDSSNPISTFVRE